jgi:hypothetical protein
MLAASTIRGAGTTKREHPLHRPKGVSMTGYARVRKAQKQATAAATRRAAVEAITEANLAAATARRTARMQPWQRQLIAQVEGSN